MAPSGSHFGLYAFYSILLLHSVFETTIRYLASMLSTYELTNEKYPALLAQATILGDKLAFAWVAVSSFVCFIIRRLRILPYRTTLFPMENYTTMSAHLKFKR